ncbi:hypothetical protein FQZ97_492540 [compost metagenome]
MKTGNYLFGIIVSFALAGLVAALSVYAVTSPYLGWGAVALLSYGLLFGGPLAIVLLLTWVVYMVRDRASMPGRAHALPLLPTLLAAMIVPVSESVQQSRRDRFRVAHPAITETHVNLSSGMIRFDTRGGYRSSDAVSYLEPGSAENRRFARFSRYQHEIPEGGGKFPYAGARLKEDVRLYEYPGQDGAPGTSVPLRRLPQPEMGKLAAAHAYGEASLLVYQYFHYADHVEVAPSIARFAATTEDAMTRARIPGLAIFGLENYTPQTIFRVEINGQTLDLGEYAARSLGPRPCDPSGGGSPALLDLDPPVRLRWQALEDPEAWHEATVAVPAFSLASKADPDTGLVRVRLYLLPDGEVAAERYKEIRSRDGKLAVRATGLPEQAKPYARCSSGAYAQYNPQTVTLLPN